MSKAKEKSRPGRKAGTAGKASKRTSLKSREAPPKKLRERNCSVAKTVNAIGDGWSFMVLRECYFGVRRFENFLSMLGLPRQTLTARLRVLTEEGLLRRVQYQDKPARYEYKLSSKGFDLYSVMIAMLVFGDKWLAAGDPIPLKLMHVPCGKPTNPVVICSSCHKPVTADETTYRTGPGAGINTIVVGAQSRRSGDPTALERRRPSSVARTLKIIGDRWSFRIMRESFYGARRFDEFEERLGIATNVLSDRLNHFVRLGIFSKVLYQEAPNRYEYRLTEKGRDLHGSFLIMLAWGDQWMSDNKPPVIMTHTKCGHDFHGVLVCDCCRKQIIASDMKYVPSYPLPTSVPKSTHVID